MAEQFGPSRGPKKKKPKFSANVVGTRSTSVGTSQDPDNVPRSRRELVVSDFRSKLCDVMSTLEREYEALYLENEALRKRVDELSDLLESNGIRADGNPSSLPTTLEDGAETHTPPPPSSLPSTVMAASSTATATATTPVGNKLPLGASPPRRPTTSAPVPIAHAPNLATTNAVTKFNATSPKLVKKLSSSSRVTRFKTTYRAGANKIRRAATFATVEVRRSLQGHTDGVWDVAHSPVTNVIGTASADRSARIWCTESTTCLMKYQGHSGSVNSVRFHPNSTMACSASGDGQIHLWRTPSAGPSFANNHIAKSVSQGNVPPPSSIPLSPSADTIIGSSSGAASGGFYTDMSNIANWAQSQDSHAPAAPADDDEVTTCGERLNEEQAENLEKCHVTRTPVTHLSGHVGVVTAAHWLADGDHIASASWDRTLKLWNAETSQCVSTLTGHDQELTNVTCHSSEKLVLTSARDMTFRMWDLSSFDCHPVHVLQAHSGTVTSAIFSSKGHVISASDDRTVKVWDMRQMRSPTVTIRASTPVNRIAVSLDAQLVALPQDNRHIRVFDINGVRLDKSSQKRGHCRMVTAAVFIPGDDSPENFYSVGFDNRLIGWSVSLPGN
ncbi:WD repeat-containing protein 37-like isoform X1 [Sycon ciliatum]|uniref:WD repeat-containing protein 37-like isoform X1 n=1 Tax=Sycon ciliatum TaxID=27933 RepID=UPI0031F686F0